jgi:hypothetical protein
MIDILADVAFVMLPYRQHMIGAGLALAAVVAVVSVRDMVREVRESQRLMAGLRRLSEAVGPVEERERARAADEIRRALVAR